MVAARVEFHPSQSPHKYLLVDEFNRKLKQLQPVSEEELCRGISEPYVN